MDFIIFFPIIALSIYFTCYYWKEYSDDKNELKSQGKIRDDLWLLKQDPHATIDDLQEIYYPIRRTAV